MKEGIFGLYNLTHYYIYNLYHHTSNYKIKCSLRFSININSFSFWFQTFEDFAVVLDDPSISSVVEVVITLDSFDSRGFNINIFTIYTYSFYFCFESTFMDNKIIIITFQNIHLPIILCFKMTKLVNCAHSANF